MARMKPVIVEKRLALPVGHHYLLFLLFLGLKLSGCIDWHWVWVFLPLIAKIAQVGARLFANIMSRDDLEEINIDEGSDSEK